MPISKYRKNCIGYATVIILALLIFPCLAYAQAPQSNLDAKLKQLEKLRESGAFSEKELAEAKQKILESLLNPSTEDLKIEGEYLVTVKEKDNDYQEDWQKMLNLNQNQTLFGGTPPGAILWVIKQTGKNVQINEYMYANGKRTNKTKLPIKKVVIDEQVARIRFVNRHRFPDGTILEIVASIALHDDGNDGFLGEYKRKTVSLSGATSGITTTSYGSISLIPDMEYTQSKPSNLDF